MRLPYGISNFADLRREGYVYADKTRFLRNLEEAEKGRRYLVFLRPRRMGKTLLLSMMEHYYDAQLAPAFDELFAGLAIAEAPTPERGRYAVLRLEMTGVRASAGIETLRAAFQDRVLDAIHRFLDRYRERVPEVVASFEAAPVPTDPALLLSRFLTAMERSPLRLYVLVDEYDNFTNDLIARGDHATYRAAVHASGFVREFYKVLKWGTATGVVGRIFMTGVSPVTLDDLTSGFNITANVTLDEDLNALCGFTSAEVRRLVDGVLADGGFSLDPSAVVDDLRFLYDGYRFSPDAAERIFNPDMVLHFAKGMAPPARYPREILDVNVRTDYGRIQRLLFTPEGAPRAELIETLEAILAAGSIPGKVRTSFPLERAYDDDHFVSLLCYLGLLTQRDEDGWPQLGIPNYAIRTLYWEAIARLLEELHQVELSSRRLEGALTAMGRDGDIGPFLDLAFSRVIRKLSNRDLIRLDEKTMKVILLAYLSLSEVFLAWSEVELGFGYGDLVLVPSRTQPAAKIGFLLELKYLKAGATEETVSARLDEADAQLRRYLADAKLMALPGVQRWKAVSVAFVATERCCWRELGGGVVKLGGP